MVSLFQNNLKTNTNLKSMKMFLIKLNFYKNKKKNGKIN